ncbi:MAG TPA: SDR family oxidoreductase [Acidimicrobiia bacterium]|nr:SDR family oxidoreductase [Acidimicrobiia bacterium]
MTTDVTDIAGKRVIVTGASSGLGAHIARRLARGGASVLAAARRGDRLEALRQELAEAPGSLTAVEADVTVEADVERVVETAVSGFGGVDALINNAGMEIQGAIDVLERADLELMLQTNVVGPYLCIRAALPHLRERGGSIVNIGSTVVDRAPLNRFGYVASKGGIEAMTRALAGDLGPDRIRVNLVRPGIVPSELRGMTEEEEAKALEQRVPRLQALEAVGAGTDVASAVSFLISDQAAWITGTVIDVDGGYVLGIPR